MGIKVIIYFIQSYFTARTIFFVNIFGYIVNEIALFICLNI